jgi:hexokinase
MGSKMVINTEWGAFDNAVRGDLGINIEGIDERQRHVLPLTRWDTAVDRISINPYVARVSV